MAETAVLHKRRSNGRASRGVPWYEKLFGVQFAELPGEGGLRAAVPLVTKPMADTALAERNSKNRPRGPGHTSSLAEAQKAGCWWLTGESVIFDWDGEMRDGQHRLAAVSESDSPSAMLVVVGVDPQSYEAIDQGRRRSLADNLREMGPQERKLVGSAVPWLQSFLSSGWQSFQRNRPVRLMHNQIETALAHPGLSASALAVSAAGRHARLFGSLGLLTALHYILGCADAKKRDKFFGALLEWTIPPGEGWEPVRQLFKRFSGSLSMNRKEPYQGIAGVTVKAWNAWRDGEPLGQLRWGSAEAFPLVSGLAYDDDGVPSLAGAGKEAKAEGGGDGL